LVSADPHLHDPGPQRLRGDDRAVNAYLADARKDGALEKADLELTIFDNQSIGTIRPGAPTALDDITSQNFVPGA
jgi:hypothetical protein